MSATNTTATVSMLTIDQFLARAAVTRPYLLEGILPTTGVVVLAAAPMAGKTLFVMALATAWGQGAPSFIGQQLSRGTRGPFILCELEHSDQSVATALRSVLAGAGGQSSTIPLLLVRPPLDLLDDAQVEALRAEAERVCACVVVVDSLRRVGNQEENDSGDMSEIGRRLSRIADNKRLVIVIHHLDAGGTRPRGSGDLSAMADAVIVMRRVNERVTLNVMSHTAADATFTFKHIGKDGAVRFEVGGSAADTLQEAIIKTLETETLTTTALLKKLRAKKVKIRNQELQSVLDALLKNGDIEDRSTRKGQHSWARTSRPPSTPSPGPAPAPNPPRPPGPAQHDHQHAHGGGAAGGDEPSRPGGGLKAPHPPGTGGGPGQPHEPGEEGTPPLVESEKLPSWEGFSSPASRPRPWERPGMERIERPLKTAPRHSDPDAAIRAAMEDAPQTGNCSCAIPEPVADTPGLVCMACLRPTCLEIGVAP